MKKTKMKMMKMRMKNKKTETIQKMKSGLTPRQQLVQGIARKEGIADDHLPEEPKKSARKLVLKKESPRAAPC